MKPLLASLLLCLCLPPAALADDALPFAAGLALPEETVSLVIAEGEQLPKETGLGFRSYARVLLGGLAHEESDGLRDSAFGQNSNQNDYVGDSNVVFIGRDGNPTQYDGVVDDLNGNLGHQFILLQDTDGDPDTAPQAAAVIQDFGDLHTFNTRFNSLAVTEERHLQSAELMGQHLVGPSAFSLDHRPAWRARYSTPGGVIDFGRLPVAERAPLLSTADEADTPWLARFSSVGYFAYGVRIDRNDDLFHFDGNTDIAGRAYTLTEARHSLIGPQLGAGRAYSNGRLQLDLAAFVTLGYGEARLRQISGFGDDPVPGGLNNLYFLQPIRSVYQKSKGYLANLAEVRMRASYQIKANWSVDAVARGYAHGTWYKAQEHIDYDQFDFGLTPFHRGSLLDGDLYLGVTYLR